MKRLLFLPLAVFLLASCKEVGPHIDLTLPVNNNPQEKDTSFLANIETPQQRVVLIEEFTGVTCPTCPPAHKVLKTIEATYPNRVAIMAIQPVGNAQTKPYSHGSIKTINDNRSQEGTDLATGIYGTISAIPVAGFDRVAQNGTILPQRPFWPEFISNRVNVPTKANMTITSTYSDSDSQAVINVRVAYTSDVTNSQLLTLALVENDVVDVQELPIGDTAPAATNYVHQHVLRDIITAPAGSAILSTWATKPAGLVYERTIVYKLPGNVLKPENCHIIGFISNSNGSDKEVVQAAEVHLK